MANVKKERSGLMFFGFSPWLIIGLAVVLALVIMVLAIRNTAREKEFVSQSLLERGNALIWALEAGTRAWMVMRNENNSLQMLMAETVKQPGVVYLVVADKDGNIIAYSSNAPLDKPIVLGDLPGLNPASNSMQWRIKSEGDLQIFEAYRFFEPFVTGGGNHQSGGGGHHMQGNMGGGRQSGNLDLYDGAVVLVGLDQGPYAKALADDFRNNVLTALILGLLGFAGFISLFWAHNYRRSHRLLKDSQALAAEVITSLPLGLITSDTKGNVGIINATALAMLGLTRKEAQNQPLAQIESLDLDKISAALNRGEKIIGQEIALKTASGKERPISLSASGITNEDGLFLGHLFILHDTAEVKRLQNEVKRNERLTALGNLAAGVAHEIRNPLSSIKGLATYIAGKEHAGVADAARTMIEEVDRLNGVVSELLDFARPATITKTPQDIKLLVQDALRLVGPDLKAKQIQTEVIQNDTLPPVMVNPEKLTQALLNLFINAVQAMPPGGLLQVAVRNIGGGDFSIAVKDSGCGIDADVQAALFTPYFTTKPNGAGLGLAIVDQIVEAHGGIISITSTPGAGSTFTITLPWE